MSDPNESDTPGITDRDDVIRYLENNDIPLPDKLTVEKIKANGEKWSIGEDGFSFQMERHPTAWPVEAPGGGTPARWHVQTRYSYNLAMDDWEITTLNREFRFDPHLLIYAEFETLGAEELWNERIERVQNAADPEAAFANEFAPIEEDYRNRSHDVPDAQLEEMINIIKREFRKRSGLTD